MGISYGPSIATSGLIFHYDMGNTSKSFKGKPTTNLNSEDIPDLEQIGPPTLTQYSSPTPIGTTAYTVTDSSTSNYQYIRRLGVATIPDDTSTYYLSLYVRKQAGAERFGINWGFVGGGTPISNNSRFNTQTGVTTGSGTVGGSVVDLGEWWRWIVTSSNNATGNTSLNVNIYPAAGQNGSDDPTATGTVVISALQVETGSFATPYVNGTRSNTQAIVDLTGNNTITATSLTYNNDNTFTFDNTLDKLNIAVSSSAQIGVGNPMSYCGWVKVKSSQNNSFPYILQWGESCLLHTSQTPSTNPVLAMNVYTAGGFEQISFSDFFLGAADTTWVHFACTWDGTSVQRMYKNGIEVAGANQTTTTTDATGSSAAIGSNLIDNNRNFNGDISVVQVYNRALSQAEVAQNFNASRARFGI